MYQHALAGAVYPGNHQDEGVGGILQGELRGEQLLPQRLCALAVFVFAD